MACHTQKIRDSVLLPPRPRSGRVSKEEVDAALPLDLKVFSTEAEGGTEAAVTHPEAEQDCHHLGVD